MYRMYGCPLPALRPSSWTLPGSFPCATTSPLATAIRWPAYRLTSSLVIDSRNSLHSLGLLPAIEAPGRGCPSRCLGQGRRRAAGACGRAPATAPGRPGRRLHGAHGADVRCRRPALRLLQCDRISCKGAGLSGGSARSLPPAIPRRPLLAHERDRKDRRSRSGALRCLFKGQVLRPPVSGICLDVQGVRGACTYGKGGGGRGAP